MLNITENERRNILNAHLAHKRMLFEQAAPTPKQLVVTPSTLADRIVKQKICFCKTDFATCRGPLTDNSGNVFIEATMITNSNTLNAKGQPIYKSGDIVTYKINGFTFNVPNSNINYTWKCSSLSGIISGIRRDVLSQLGGLGYTSLENIPNLNKADLEAGKYEVLDLTKKYPFLYPDWEPTDDKEKYLYLPKSPDFQQLNTSVGVTPQEQSRIDDAKEKNHKINLMTQDEVMDDEGVKDFNAIKDKYTAYQIGWPKDNVFNRNFFLYAKNTGQSSAKDMASTAKTAVKELNISKSTCSKLISQLYEMYRVNQTNLQQMQFDNLKKQVTYCAMKYDKFGIIPGLGGVDDKIDKLKTLSSTNKFKISVR